MSGSANIKFNTANNEKLNFEPTTMEFKIAMQKQL